MELIMKTVDTIVYGLYEDYTLMSYNDLNNMKNVGVVSHFSNFFTDIYLSKRLAHMLSLPFKQKYFDKCISDSELKLNTKYPFFIFFESKYAYAPEYLNYLRNRYPYSTICLIFLNPLDMRRRYQDWRPILGLYDFIITCVPDDAKKYGFLYFPSCYSKNANVDISRAIVSDITYTGLTGSVRDARLFKIYDLLSSAGYRCDFHIVDPKVKHDQLKNGIFFHKKKFSYMDVINRTISSNSVLELVQDNLNYQTLRTMESLVYGRKLVTSNRSIIKSCFYNENDIFVLDEDFDLEKFKSFMGKKEVLISPDTFSPRKLIQFIHEHRRVCE